jgi:Protein of unknown function (DUF3443)
VTSADAARGATTDAPKRCSESSLLRSFINLSVSMTLIALCVAACSSGSNSSGGGFGSSSSSSISSSSSGSSSSSVSSSSSGSSSSCIASGGVNTGASNVATVVVDPGPACAQVQGQGQLNLLYVTVVLCAPGTATCQTIDHVQVDTGSYGLRILSQALQPALAAALPIVKESVSSEALAECTQFVDGYSWGPIRSADMQIAGEKASGIEIQVIGDPSYAQVPGTCSSYGSQEDTVQVFGANGILGVGPFVQDAGLYYVCASPTSCTQAKVSLAQQVSNPVAFFTNSSNGVADNNGVIVQLPALAAGGAPSVQGSLVFGIDTEPNNKMTASNVLKGDMNTGEITTMFNSQTLTQSYIDSGSNAYYFVDSSLPTCQMNTGFYCPASETKLNATNQGGAGSTPPSNVIFYVGYSDNLNAANSAFDDIAGCPVSASGSVNCPASSSTFDWGIPFFFGLPVGAYTAIACNQPPGSCKTTSQGYGPYFAY